jgi:TPR repeat protein
MIAAMHMRAVLISLGLAGCLVSIGTPARAQFYSLDGAYHCVTKADASCSAEASLPPPPPPPPPVYTGPTMNSVIAGIRAKKLGAAEMQFLEARAEQKEPRAVETLAWCKLNGVGWPADPIAAFFLYGEAAQLGVPAAKDNQVTIFESRLTQQQRQDVLMKLQTTH